MNITFFLGDDITSHFIAQSSIPLLAEHGHSVHIALTRQPPRREAPADLAKLFFFERTLLDEYVYPYLESLPASHVRPTAKLQSFDALAQSYGNVSVMKKVGNVNDPALISYLRRNNVTAGVSVRCYQKFGSAIIHYFEQASRNSRSIFVNLHPGLLPQYRGVFTFARAMSMAENEAGFTLHHINGEWDAGPIIDSIARPLDYSNSVLENMCSQYLVARDLLITSITNLAMNATPPSREQDQRRTRYFTHMTMRELAELRSKGIPRVDGEKIIELLVNAFTRSNSNESFELRDMLRAAAKRHVSGP